MKILYCKDMLEDIPPTAMDNCNKKLSIQHQFFAVPLR